MGNGSFLMKTTGPEVDDLEAQQPLLQWGIY